jgi:uncharacterized UPF0160 family protein
MIKKVATHHGTFHADDVFAYVFLTELFDNIELVRTRDEKELATCDLVFDVGGGEFDHHSTKKESRNQIPYAASGLIWRKYGRKIIHKYGITKQSEVDSLFLSIDKNFIQGLDAVDNGVKIEKNINIPDISLIIHQFNPVWINDKNDHDAAFFNASDFARTVFKNMMNHQIANIKAKHLIKDEFIKRAQKEILVLNRACSWTQTLLDIDENEEVMFVIYPDVKDGYRVQVVPREIGSFEARISLPRLWGGKEKDELNEFIGINDAIFCHPGLFIAGAYSIESAIKMAQLALEQ